MYKRYIKRAIDIFFSIILMPFILLVLGICAIFIKLEDRGPIFYCGERLGKNGRVFKMYKLRSMIVNAPDIRNQDGSTYNSNEDSRLTKIGKFLRKTSLDELPQVFNVIKGDMSFIGPRPDLPEHIKYYDNEEFKKLELLPGITGYSQAYFRNSIEWKQRLKNDIYYVRNICFFLDVKILLKTISVILKCNGIYTSSASSSKDVRF